MKKLVFLFTFLAVNIICFAQGKIVFKETEHNFGKIPEKGGVVLYEFAFTNEGNQPVLLQNVSASCGCTTPKWSRDPIAPKEKSSIIVQYNPLGRVGAFNKSIKVYNNTSEGTIELHIQGEVVAKEPVQPIEGFVAKFASGDSKFLTTDVSFGTFIERALNSINKEGNITLQIEGSASKLLPAKTANSTDIALSRASNVENKIIESLKAKGIDKSKIVIKKLAHVQGPDVTKENKKKKDVFSPFDYVKVEQIP